MQYAYWWRSFLLFENRGLRFFCNPSEMDQLTVRCRLSEIRNISNQTHQIGPRKHKPNLNSTQKVSSTLRKAKYNPQFCDDPEFDVAHRNCELHSQAGQINHCSPGGILTRPNWTDVDVWDASMKCEMAARVWVLRVRILWKIWTSFRFGSIRARKSTCAPRPKLTARVR